ncbi:MAG: hypothetical protein QM661_15675 [Solimonas sp.]
MQRRANSKLLSKLLYLLLLLCPEGSLMSNEARAAEPAPPVPAIESWNAMVNHLQTLPDRMLAKLPQEMRENSQLQQEIARYALGSLAYAVLDALGSDGDHPAFLPASGPVLNIGQPNADTVYRVARITPGGSYRLRGKRGSLRIASIGQVPPSPGEPGYPPAKPFTNRGYQDLNALKTDATGHFDVLLSPKRPEGYDGEWWPLNPDANKLLLRLVSADWAHEEFPTISIERIDHAVIRPRPDAAELMRRLQQISTTTDFMALMFVDHVEKLRQQGYVNQLKSFDISKSGGLDGQFYYEGVYELTDDEALLIETKVPAHCGYRSLILTNEVYETTDWYDNHSSLNDAQASPDADGVLRIVVSARDPGVPNWLDTAGYPRGIVQGRWTYCDSAPVPEVRKVAVSEVRKLLPAETLVVTPAQREAIIRERRAAVQQRPLW